MDKLITNELSLGLDQKLRNDLIDNFKKIQNGINGQYDLFEKQILSMLGDLPLQDQNEVTQARIDASGKAYQTMKSRLDIDQQTAETALAEERQTSNEVANARTSREGKSYHTLKERIDSESDDINATFNEKLATMSLVPEIFANLTSLKAKYPDGKMGIFITNDDGHWNFYDYNSSKWQDGGIYRYPYDYGKGFLSGDPIPNMDKSTNVAIVQRNGSGWFKISGKDNTNPNKGIHFLASSAGFTEMAKQPVRITFDLVSDKAQRLGIGVNYYDVAGNSLGIETFSKIDMPAKEVKHVHIVKQVNASLVERATQFSFYFTVPDADMAPWYITNLSGIIQGDEIKLPPLDGNMIPNPDFTQDLVSNVTPNNSATTIRTAVLEGNKWLVMEGDDVAADKGVYWTISKSDYSNMFDFPIIFKLKYQLTIMQNLSIKAIYFNKNDEVLGAEEVAQIKPTSTRYSEEQFKFNLNKSNYQNVAYIHLALINPEPQKIGRIIVTDVSMYMDYTSLNFGVGNILNKSAITPQANTAVDYEYSDGELANKIVLTSTSDKAQYKGLSFETKVSDVESIYDYPISLSAIFRSTIDQTLEISVNYLDSDGNKLGSTSGEYVVLTKGVNLFKRLSFNLNRQYQDKAASVKFLILKSTAETLGKLELKNPEIRQDYAVGQVETSAVMKGKTLNIIGDSYVANNGQPVARTWHFKLAKNNAMNYNNYGINGNGLISPDATDKPVVERYTEMPDDADYIIVIGGRNDYNQQLPLDDFKAGLDTLILGLVQKYLGKKICFFTPWSDQGPAHDNPIALHEYANAIEEKCEQYGIPCFNSSKKAGMATYNADFRSKYFQSADDVSHLNADGHDLFLNKAQKFIESL